MKYIKLKKYLLLLITTLFSLLFIKGYTMASITKNNLYYGVDIDLHNVGVDIRVNDLPVYFDDEQGQLTTEIPAPDSIINGENQLSIDVFLPYDNATQSQTTSYPEGAYLMATLFEQDLTSSDSKKTKLSSISLTINELDALITTQDYIKEYQHSSTIKLESNKRVNIKSSTNISSPFPRWAWQDGNIIKDNTQNYESLLKKYQEIHNTLTNKDLTKLKALYNQRSQEISYAYNLSDLEAGHQKLSVGNDMGNSDLELNELFIDGMKLELLGDGKIARLTNDLKAQPIFYFDESTQAFHLYKFMFYLNDQNEWIMIR